MQLTKQEQKIIAEALCILYQHTKYPGSAFEKETSKIYQLRNKFLEAIGKPVIKITG